LSNFLYYVDKYDRILNSCDNLLQRVIQLFTKKYRMKNIVHRSPAFISGLTDRKPHFHIDLPREEVPKLFIIVNILEKLGFECAIDQVLLSIGGPQRKVIPWMYDLHNVPGDTEGEETLGAFSSTVIESIDDLLFAIECITPELLTIKGGIVEAEQPVVLYRKNGWDLLIPKSEYMRPIRQEEINLTVKTSMKFETHHWVSIPKNLPRIDLKKLNKFLTENGLEIGGLFIMDDGASWGYASNSFSNDENFRKRIEWEHEAWRSFFMREGLPLDDVESLVEAIIFVGKTD